MSRGTWELQSREPHTFRLQGYHLLWRVFPDASARYAVCNSPTAMRSSPTEAPQPRMYNARTLDVHTGLGCFPFARRY